MGILQDLRVQDFGNLNFHPWILAQKPPINGYADIFIKARDVNFDQSLHLHPYFLSREGSDKSQLEHMLALPEPSLLKNMISTKILCADSYYFYHICF